MKKTGIIAAAGLAALISSCSSSFKAACTISSVNCSLCTSNASAGVSA